MSTPAPSPLRDIDPVSERQRRLEQLFAAHGPAVFAFARRRSSAADADEVVSATFLVAWRRLDEVPDNALPWLLGVARRSLANLRRGEARQSALQQRLAGATAHEVSAGPPESGVSGRVQRALATLPPAERDALTLLAWDELTPDEVAVVLGCSRAAVYVRIHRARRRLARTLERIPHDD